MKLLAAISHHGLGHLAQVAPVVQALAARCADLELTIWSGLDSAALQRRIALPFTHRWQAADVGLVMLDAMRVDRAASHAAYRRFHADWDGRVAEVAAWLRVQGFDTVLADAAYLPLAGAQRAGIRAIGLCSLNWHDIAAACLAGLPDMDAALAQMAAAYGAADVFLRPQPAMPMPWLANVREIPPIAALGCERRAEIARRLGLAPDERLVLAGFGGIGYRASLARIDGVRWLVPQVQPGRADQRAFAELDLSFLDLLASCDALVTKVGYGGFVEAAAHAVPVAYLDRPDWPETPHLADWLRRHVPACPIDEQTLASPSLAEHLRTLWSAPPARRTPVPGAEVAAAWLLGEA